MNLCLQLAGFNDENCRACFMSKIDIWRIPGESNLHPQRGGLQQRDRLCHRQLSHNRSLAIAH
jgi:hypothetical protein